MKMIKITNTRHKIYAIIILTGLLVIGLGIFIIWPWQQKIITAKFKIQENRQEIEEMQQRQEALIYSGRKYNELQNNGISNLEQIFVSRDGVLKFVNELEELALINNINQSIFLNEASIAKDEEALILDLSLEGDYLSLINYLQKLEQQSFYFDWQEIIFKESISKESSDVNAIVLVVNVKTKIYWLN